MYNQNSSDTLEQRYIMSISKIMKFNIFLDLHRAMTLTLENSRKKKALLNWGRHVLSFVKLMSKGKKKKSSNNYVRRNSIYDD